MTAASRRVITDPDGTVLSYVPRTRDGRPWADRARATGPGPARIVFDRLAGWAVSCQEDLAGPLIAHGAVVARRGNRMACDLREVPPPPHWRGQRPPAAFRIVPCDRPARDLLEAWRAAYPADHPDHFPADDQTAVRERLGPLIAGRLYGPLLPFSALVANPRNRIVAAALVNDFAGEAPRPGPWITELFRQPAPLHAGLGTLLLRRILADAAHAGHTAISLAVTEGNPAQHLYAGHGFRLIEKIVTLFIP
ncbi:GNAT family N-acetyltransferase [Actinocrispum sp. NPDC049592]|uniref:GNAT family N-acetyltransferase n=1 Tax=Actinocrispum sp. NPDC049592 TaxID=3154835 RepID=UPI00342AF4F0